MEYDFYLQPYSGANSRHTCPSCGHQNEFVYYVDASGKALSPLVGKCNRDKCGYHLTPRQFFSEHPELAKPTSQQAVASSLPPQPTKQQQFVPASTLDTFMLNRGQNALYKWLCTLFCADKVNEVFDRYHVGTSSQWRKDGYFAALFPQVNEKGQVCQVKAMAYDPTNGKRLHRQHPCEQWDNRTQTYIPAPNNADRLMFLGKRLLGNDVVLKQTYFGAHLLPQASSIGIVESEKTALICSLILPQYTWLATGGKNGCRWTSPEQAELLKGKNVTLFADEDAIEEWERKADILRSQGIQCHVSHICEGKGSHTDIADLLLEQRCKPAPPPPKPQTLGEVLQLIEECNFPKQRLKITIK